MALIMSLLAHVQRKHHMPDALLMKYVFLCILICLAHTASAAEATQDSGVTHDQASLVGTLTNFFRDYWIASKRYFNWDRLAAQTGRTVDDLKDAASKKASWITELSWFKNGGETASKLRADLKYNQLRLAANEKLIENLTTKMQGQGLSLIEKALLVGDLRQARKVEQSIKDEIHRSQNALPQTKVDIGGGLASGDKDVLIAVEKKIKDTEEALNLAQTKAKLEILNLNKELVANSRKIASINATLENLQSEITKSSNILQRDFETGSDKSFIAEHQKILQAEKTLQDLKLRDANKEDGRLKGRIDSLKKQQSEAIRQLAETTFIKEELVKARASNAQEVAKEAKFEKYKKMVSEADALMLKKVKQTENIDTITKAMKEIDILEAKKNSLQSDLKGLRELKNTSTLRVEAKKAITEVDAELVKAKKALAAANNMQKKIETELGEVISELKKHQKDVGEFSSELSKEAKVTTEVGTGDSIFYRFYKRAEAAVGYLFGNKKNPATGGVGEVNDIPKDNIDDLAKKGDVRATVIAKELEIKAKVAALEAELTAGKAEADAAVAQVKAEKAKKAEEKAAAKASKAEASATSEMASVAARKTADQAKTDAEKIENIAKQARENANQAGAESVAASKKAREIEATVKEANAPPPTTEELAERRAVMEEADKFQKKIQNSSIDDILNELKVQLDENQKMINVDPKANSAEGKSKAAVGSKVDMLLKEYETKISGHIDLLKTKSAQAIFRNKIQGLTSVRGVSQDMADVVLLAVHRQVQATVEKINAKLQGPEPLAKYASAIADNAEEGVKVLREDLAAARTQLRAMGVKTSEAIKVQTKIIEMQQVLGQAEGQAKQLRLKSEKANEVLAKYLAAQSAGKSVAADVSSIAVGPALPSHAAEAATPRLLLLGSETGSAAAVGLVAELPREAVQPAGGSLRSTKKLDKAIATNNKLKQHIDVVAGIVADKKKAVRNTSRAVVDVGVQKQAATLSMSDAHEQQRVADVQLSDAQKKVADVNVERRGLLAERADAHAKVLAAQAEHDSTQKSKSTVVELSAKELTKAEKAVRTAEADKSRLDAEVRDLTEKIAKAEGQLKAIDAPISVKGNGSKVAEVRSAHMIGDRARVIVANAGTDEPLVPAREAVLKANILLAEQDVQEAQRAVTKIQSSYHRSTRKLIGDTGGLKTANETLVQAQRRLAANQSALEQYGNRDKLMTQINRDKRSLATAQNALTAASQDVVKAQAHVTDTTQEIARSTALSTAADAAIQAAGQKVSAATRELAAIDEKVQSNIQELTNASEAVTAAEKAQAQATAAVKSASEGVTDVTGRAAKIVGQFDTASRALQKIEAVSVQLQELKGASDMKVGQLQAHVAAQTPVTQGAAVSQESLGALPAPETVADESSARGIGVGAEDSLRLTEGDPSVNKQEVGAAAEAGAGAAAAAGLAKDAKPAESRTMVKVFTNVFMAVPKGLYHAPGVVAGVAKAAWEGVQGGAGMVYHAAWTRDAAKFATAKGKFCAPRPWAEKAAAKEGAQATDKVVGKAAEEGAEKAATESSWIMKGLSHALPCLQSAMLTMQAAFRAVDANALKESQKQACAAILDLGTPDKKAAIETRAVDAARQNAIAAATDLGLSAGAIAAAGDAAALAIAQGKTPDQAAVDGAAAATSFKPVLTNAVGVSQVVSSTALDAVAQAYANGLQGKSAAIASPSELALMNIPGGAQVIFDNLGMTPEQIIRSVNTKGLGATLMSMGEGEEPEIAKKFGALAEAAKQDAAFIARILHVPRPLSTLSGGIAQEIVDTPEIRREVASALDPNDELHRVEKQVTIFQIVSERIQKSRDLVSALDWVVPLNRALSQAYQK